MAETVRLLMEKDDLQPLADSIKNLRDNEANITLEEMNVAVMDANDEVADQAELLAQLAIALEGKSVSGDSGNSIETCTLAVSISSSNVDTTIWDVVYTSLDNDIPVVHIDTNRTTIAAGSTYTLNNIVVGRPISFVHYTTGVEDSVTNGEIVYHTPISSCTSVFMPTVANVVMSIVLGGEPSVGPH